MDEILFTPLQLREVFHLEFLRCFGRKIKAESYALKGGTNLRFFFKSLRYSEDMDLDIQNVEVHVLKDTVMKILETSSFQDSLKTFGIERAVPPNITHAKQTETTQRFKIHLISSAGEDLFTKLEFSRRGFKGTVLVQPVSNSVLRVYKLLPLLAPHYDIESTVIQKIEALSTRSIIQARDVFDLYILSSQYEYFGESKEIKLDKNKLLKASNNVFTISFEQFRDTVISYLSYEDQVLYNSSSLWDEIQLKVNNLIEELKNKYV